MNMTKALMGLTVLVTRPTHQATFLVELLEREGAQVFAIPTIAILPPANGSVFSKQLHELKKTDIALFTSANCLRFKNFTPFLSDFQENHLKIGAIGAATAHALQQANIPVHFLPEDTYNSENLLKLPILQKIQNKKIMLFSGAGGRNLLYKVLEAREAHVTKVICYQRKIPLHLRDDLQEVFNQHRIQAILCQSNASLQNLFAMLDTTGQTYIKMQQLFGYSTRLYPLAAQLGFKNRPLIAAQAKDRGIVDTIIKWKAKHDRRYSESKE